MKYNQKTEKRQASPKEGRYDDDWVGKCECGFQSLGWPTKRAATSRMEEHKREHTHKEEMRSLEEVSDADRGR